MISEYQKRDIRTMKKKIVITMSLALLLGFCTPAKADGMIKLDKILDELGFDMSAPLQAQIPSSIRRVMKL